MLDKLSIFSDHQVITKSVASDKVMDFSKMRFAGSGDPINVNIIVVEDFDKLTNLKIKMQCSADGTTGWEDIAGEETLPLASLTVGKRAALRFLPHFPHTKPYLRLFYTVTGTAPSKGKIFADLASGEQVTFQDGMYFSPRNPSGSTQTA